MPRIKKRTEKIDIVKENPNPNSIRNIHIGWDDDGWEPFYPEKNPHYISRPIDEEMMSVLAVGGVPFMGGDAGCGKTEAARNLAVELNVPFNQVGVNNTVDGSEMWGVFVLSQGPNSTLLDAKFQWNPKEILRYLAMPSVVCVDELPFGSSGRLQEFFQLFTEGSIYIHQLGMTFRKHPECYIVCTGNYPHYEGVKSLNAALEDRLSFIPVTTIPVEQFPLVLEREGEPMIDRDKYINFLNEFSETLKSQNSKNLLTFRRINMANELIANSKLPLKSVIKIAYYNVLEYENKNILEETWGHAIQYFGFGGYYEDESSDGDILEDISEVSEDEFVFEVEP